jgi:hypothetical protein
VAQPASVASSAVAVSSRRLRMPISALNSHRARGPSGSSSTACRGGCRPCPARAL